MYLVIKVLDSSKGEIESHLVIILKIKSMTSFMVLFLESVNKCGLLFWIEKYTWCL